MSTPIPKNIQTILFDMDGVLLDSERGWRQYGANFWQDIGIKELPKHISERIYGISMSEEYGILQKEIGLNMTLEEYVATYDKYSLQVYTESKISEELEKTLAELQRRQFHLAIVTPSLGSWVELFFKRLRSNSYFDFALSIADEEGLSPKPSPDGYVEAMRRIGSSSSETIAVEDSNRGIRSAKSAGLYTLASTEFIDSDYTQEGFDSQISGVHELVRLLTY